MAHALKFETARVYARHAAAADRRGWSVLSGVQWGEIDARRARSQPEVVESVRRHTLALSARSARTARALAAVADDPHASAALTLDLWDGLKHIHALRTYLDTVDWSPRISDSDLRSVRGDPSAAHATGSITESLVALMLTQLRSAMSLRSIGTGAEESVLAELLALLAGDESRHAQITCDLLTLRMGEGTSTVTEVRDAVALLTQVERAQEPADAMALRAFAQRVNSLIDESGNR